MNIREKQSVTSTDPVISSSAGRLDKIPLLGLQTNNKYPLNITHKYNVHVTANFQIQEIMTVCQGPIDSGKSIIVCSVRETGCFDTKSFQYKSF